MALMGRGKVFLMKLDYLVAEGNEITLSPALRFDIESAINTRQEAIEFTPYALWHR